MIKYSHYFYTFSICILASCANQTKTGENTDTVDVTKDSTVSIVNNDSLKSIVPIRSDTSVAFMALKKYLPGSIPGYKTEGYPDINDNFTGEPTGETNSPFTSGGPVSFIKHLYKKNDAEIAVEIIDYKSTPAVYKDLLRMFNPTVKVDNEMETKYLLKDIYPGTITQVIHNKSENKSTAHIFVCDRFLVNINTVNTGKNNMIQETIKHINFDGLSKDLCEKNTN